MGWREEFRSYYTGARRRRGRCGAALRALDYTLYDRSRVWSDMRALYELARLGGRSRWRSLWFVLSAYWEPAPPDHLALARAAIGRRDWSAAAAELRSWNVGFDWEDDADQQRSELREAALALERGDLVAARDRYVQVLKLKQWGDRDALSMLLTEHIEGRKET